VIVYVESNFVLELAFRQEDCKSCEDSIVYASVHSRIVSENDIQCFINKNTRDFLIPEIQEDFMAHKCRLLGKFSDGLGFVKGTLHKAGEP